MSVRTFAAARFICQASNWQVTNLALQKILYVAHMIHLGRTGEKLIKPAFEAWDYGPVVPKLYRIVRAFGSGPIQDVFSTERDIKDTPEGKTLASTCQALLKLTPGQLVALTHMKGGAWERNYLPGVRGIEIPTGDILDEYRVRKTSTKSAA
jgi:uncharacterized phage-associated protein